MKNTFNTKKSINNIIFIPARGGSTRIKNKNLQKIKGISLLKRKILICKKSAIGKIVVSSNCNKILKEASQIKGVETFKRQKIYATSQASSISSILEYLRHQVKNEFLLPKFISLVPVTNPFLKHNSLKLGFNKINRYNDLDAVISITENSEHPFLNVKVNKKLKFNIFRINGKTGADFERSQDRPKTYIETASFRISKTSYFLKYINEKNPKFNKVTFNQKSCGFIKISKKESFDINSIEDLKLAQLLAR